MERDETGAASVTSGAFGLTLPLVAPLLGVTSRLPASGARRSVPPHDRSAGND